ncbi:MAG: response regulator transcription factor [Chloroflexi bacterium]|nr:response regulator transcription factor [Chloroflexota bacterium]
MAQILIIDDDPVIRSVVEHVLQQDGHDVRAASNGEQGIHLLRETPTDLVLLDVVMPHLNGLEVCRRIRSDPYLADMPCIFLTSKDRPDDVASGLDTGADDYVSKAALAVELPARVRAVLRRMGQDALGNSRSSFVEMGQVKLHRTQPLLRVAGATVHLTPIEHRLLYRLIQQPGQPISTDQLLEDVWEYYPGTGDPKTVRVTVTRLRNKLRDEIGLGSLIKTVRGRGYMLA